MTSCVIIIVSVNFQLKQLSAKFPPLTISYSCCSIPMYIFFDVTLIPGMQEYQECVWLTYGMVSQTQSPVTHLGMLIWLGCFFEWRCIIIVLRNVLKVGSPCTGILWKRCRVTIGKPINFRQKNINSFNYSNWHIFQCKNSGNELLNI